MNSTNSTIDKIIRHRLWDGNTLDFLPAEVAEDEKDMSQLRELIAGGGVYFHRGNRTTHRTTRAILLECLRERRQLAIDEGDLESALEVAIQIDKLKGLYA